MAKLSAHGKEIGRLHYATFSDAYFEDGKILRNSGSGWKLRAKVKQGVDIREHFAKNEQRQKDVFDRRPSLAAYRRELLLLGGLKRWKLHAAIELMPDDADGVWSEACDGYGDNISASIEEVSNLCRLYALAVAERKEQQKDPTCVLCDTGEVHQH